MQPPPPQPTQRLQGSVDRVTFHNPENGYSVIRVKAKGQSDLVTLLGHLPSVSPGEWIEAEGGWVNHNEYGLQFRATTARTIHPSTIEGIEKYLGSGMVPGIGPAFAKRLVEKFGEGVFDIIESHPEKLKSVEGIGTVRARRILDAWKEQRVVREIMVFLQSHGVSSLKAVRIYKTYGQDAVSKVSENPYRLAVDIHGIGFKSADRIAQNLGVAKDSPVRARAGLHHVLFECMSQGHTAFPRELLLGEAEKILEIDKGILEKALEAEVLTGSLRAEPIEDTPCIFSAAMLYTEGALAQLFHSLARGKPPWEDIQTEKAMEWIEKRTSIQLAPLQREAIKLALTSKVMVVTGGPGTGKTTLIRSIVDILNAKKVRLLLCSPTGRAAKRLSECTGLEAKTIHRTLGIDRSNGGFLHDGENPLHADCIVVDEVSMIDTVLAYNLLKAVPKHAALVLVGDVDQLPSVGPGQVLGSILDSGRIPSIRLSEIFRQAARSRIIRVAHDVNSGRMPNLEKPPETTDFYFISSETPEDSTSKIVDLVANRISRRFGVDPISDIQVLCPMNRGGLGARSLNVEIQKALNPDPAVRVERFGSIFAPKDKVIVTQNDYDKEVFNGDIGTISQLDLSESVATIDFDGRNVEFRFSEMDILSLAYAITIHKAQGSEYPVVVIPIAMQHYLMLRRNLIYTGITRGKRLVILVGQKKALAIAVRNTKALRRWTNLEERIQTAFDSYPSSGGISVGNEI